MLPPMLLAFSRGTTPLGWLVLLLTRPADLPLSESLRRSAGHVAILVPSPDGDGYDRYEALGRGVAYCPVDGPDAGEWTVAVALSPERVGVVTAWLDARVGDRYDWPSILMSAVCVRWPTLGALLLSVPRIERAVYRPDTWTCSRLAAEALRVAGASVPVLPRPYTPNDVQALAQRRTSDPAPPVPPKGSTLL